MNVQNLLQPLVEQGKTRDIFWAFLGLYREITKCQNPFAECDKFTRVYNLIENESKFNIPSSTLGVAMTEIVSMFDPSDAVAILSDWNKIMHYGMLANS